MPSQQPTDATRCGNGARSASSNPRASSPSSASPMSSAHSPSSRRLPRLTKPVSPPYQAPLRIDAWSLVLSLLPPRDIACAALACSSLAAAAAAVTAARAADATGGSEPRAVPFLAPDCGLSAGATAAGSATTSSVPRYSYFRYSRANVRVASDESSFPSSLIHFQNRQTFSQPGTAQHESRASAKVPPIIPPIAPPYPYPQPPWWWGMLPDYLNRCDRADDSKRAEQQQLTRPGSRPFDVGGGEERQQQRKSFLGAGDAQDVRGDRQSIARNRKRKREGGREGEGEAEAEWQAEQRTLARQALQPHALQDALMSLLPAVSPCARSGGGRRAWPGCDCCARGHTQGKAGESAEEGEGGEGEEAGARDSGSGDCGGGNGSHSCCTRTCCPCAAPLVSKTGRSREHARSMHAGRERGDRPEGRRGQQEEGGGEADEAEEGEAGEDDVVFECGPLCSCALQQHRIASHPGPHTATSTVETAEAAPAAPAAAEAVEGGATITPACPTCPNRSSQRGVQWNLAVVWSGRKGWTLVAQESIPRGAFICQYAGEVVSAGEASARQALYDAAGLHVRPCARGEGEGQEDKKAQQQQEEQEHEEKPPQKQQQQQEKRQQQQQQQQQQSQFHHHHHGTPYFHTPPPPRPSPRFLFTLREHLPSGAILRTQIDPSRMGSLGRFMSHECGGGNVARVVVRQAGCLLPAVGLVARREVRQGEELTFSYGGVGEGEGEDGDGDGKREVEGGEGGSVGGDDGEGGRVEGEEDGREECWKSGWEQQQQQQRRLVKRSKCCCGSVRCSGYLPFDML
ncbi:unnamed protein product [Closterium sp. NIES-64]|nr:unnamed protein product [Closterium sp. NIES-64]